ncbi:hypothetical protein [Campylobacter majalis]|uniref:hypothetical protein n=1 Tax=Campylobacter majalis TaxID=2790656 RepID=UPI003D69F8BD
MYKKDCELGNLVGCYSIAVLYENGDIVKQDLKKAFELYSKTCVEFPVACNNIGLMYKMAEA